MMIIIITTLIMIILNYLLQLPHEELSWSHNPSVPYQSTIKQTYTTTDTLKSDFMLQRNVIDIWIKRYFRLTS